MRGTSDEHNLRVLGRAIRELREQRGLDVDALAAAASIPAVDLTALEAGRFEPDYRALLRLAAGLGVRPIALLLRVEELDAGEHS